LRNNLRQLKQKAIHKINDDSNIAGLKTKEERNRKYEELKESTQSNLSKISEGIKGISHDYMDRMKLIYKSSGDRQHYKNIKEKFKLYYERRIDEKTKTNDKKYVTRLFFMGLGLFSTLYMWKKKYRQILIFRGFSYTSIFITNIVIFVIFNAYVQRKINKQYKRNLSEINKNFASNVKEVGTDIINEGKQ
jgi:hypothetical protein